MITHCCYLASCLPDSDKPVKDGCISCMHCAQIRKMSLPSTVAQMSKRVRRLTLCWVGSGPGSLFLLLALNWFENLHMALQEFGRTAFGQYFYAVCSPLEIFNMFGNLFC